MEKNNEELALITQAKYGYVDNQGVGLSLTIRILRGATQLFVDNETAKKFIEETKLEDVTALRGAPVVVSVGEDRMVRFERFLT